MYFVFSHFTFSRFFDAAHLSVDVVTLEKKMKNVKNVKTWH